jgi:uncharacterized protein YjbI with pentapeptide repeats
MSKRWADLSRGTQWLLGSIAAVVLALVATWVLFVPAADWLAHHDVGSITGTLHETALDNARGRLLTFGAGLFAAGALVFTALNFNLLRRNSERTDQWQRRTHELTEQGQVTDRYTKAIEQLGSDKLDVRIGSIYALERIARDSPRDHPTVMEVLSAFTREHSHEPWPLPGPDDEDADLVEFTRPDIQAALTVVRRRDVKHDIGSIDLTRADLTRADLTDAFLGSADLHDADLTGAQLTGAQLTGAQLTHAYLTGADLHDADLTGADLTYADLARAWLIGADLHDATLSAADLTEARLMHANFTDARLEGANLTGADLTSARLEGAVLADTDLTGARWPADPPVPEGWKLDTGSGRLERAGTDS